MQSYRILVADDEPADLYLLKQAFEEAGHVVITCPDGASALVAARKAAADVIVADSLMPGTDGFQLCQKLRRDPQLCALPLVLVSAVYTDREDEALAARVGADLYLRKPDDMPHVVERVTEVFRRVRSEPPRQPLLAPLDREITEAYARRVAARMEAKVIELRAANDALQESEGAVKSLNRRLEATVGELQAGIAERRRVVDMLNLAEKVGRVGSWSVDLGSGITTCSPQAAAILGLSPDAVELDWERLISAAPLSERKRAHDILRRQAAAEGEYDFELTLSLPEVGERILHFRSEVFGAAGGAGRRIGTIQDVTAQRAAEQERQQLEQRLNQANKLEAVGRLAAGVAHDFNNILAAIVSHGELVRLAMPGNEVSEVESGIDEILQACQRAKELIRQILTFARQQKTERSPMQLGDVVKEAVRMMRPTAPLDVEITVAVAPDCPLVLGNETQLHQVVVNLCRNALQAMEATGGALGVHLSPIQIDPGFAAAHPPLKAGPGLLLRISDSGVGIDRAVIPNLFEPFFSTRVSRGGTGLGLAVVHGIVLHHEGFIHVESTLGKGTIFSIWLPAALASANGGRTEGGDVVSGSGHRVMVVDDEPSVATICARLLRRLGFEAEAVTDPLVAREKLLASPQAIDVLLTDYAMPRLSGVELARTVWTVRPALPVILAAGYGGGMTRESAMAIGFRDLMFKPYSLETLGTVCRAALA